MNRRAKCLTLGIAIGSGAVGAAIILLNPLAGFRSGDEEAEPSLPTSYSHSDKESMFTNFSTARYTDDGKPVFQLKIGECELRPRTVLSGKLEFAKVAKMSDVRMDLFHWRQTKRADNSMASVGGAAQEKVTDAPTDDSPRRPRTPRRVAPARNRQCAALESCRVGVSALTDIVQHMRRLPGWESVNGVDIRNVSVNIYEETNLTTGVKAQRLLPGPEGKIVLEKDVTVTADGGRRQLTSDQVVWWTMLGCFAVRGRYSLNDMGRNVRGTRTLFDLKLEAITNKEEVSEYEQRAQHRPGSHATQ